MGCAVWASYSRGRGEFNVEIEEGLAQREHDDEGKREKERNSITSRTRKIP